MTEDSLSVEINEYKLMKTLNEISEENLERSGYTAEQISAIREYEEVYTKHIEGLSEQDDETLKCHGYSDEQIAVIRSFGGTDAEIMSLAATLNISATPINFTGQDGSYTRGRLAYSWNWVGIPAVKMQDMIAVSWNGWVVEEDVGYVYYYHVNTGEFCMTGTPTLTNANNSLYAAGHKFAHRPGSTIESDYYYAKSGSGYFNVRSDVHTVKDFFYYVEYGHTTVTVSVGISFEVTLEDAGFSGSISFDTGSVCVGNDEGQYLFEE